jgi:hypothetical protein
MEMIYLATATLTKLSILTFYRRISSSVLSRPLLGVIWGSILFGKLNSVSSSLDSFIYMCTYIYSYPDSLALRPRKYPRPSLHMLPHRSLLVPLHHLVATHTLVPLRRRSRLPRFRHHAQHAARFSCLSDPYVRSASTTSSMAAETGSRMRVWHGISVRMNCCLVHISVTSFLSL